MALTRIDLVHQLDKWVARSGNRVVARADTKQRAIRETAEAARRTEGGASVRIHTRDGRFQEERTYPNACGSATPAAGEGGPLLELPLCRAHALAMQASDPLLPLLGLLLAIDCAQRSKSGNPAHETTGIDSASSIQL